MRPIIACGLLLSSAILAQAAEDEVKLTISPSSPPAFVVSGLSLKQLTELAADEKLRGELLQVFVEPMGDVAKVPPVAGKVEVREKDGIVVFTPRFPFQSGMEYRAQLTHGKTTQERFLKIPDPAATKPTSLLAIYPTSNKLPENQLRFYLHFSAPMSRGEAYEHLRLTKADGSEVDLPFLEIGEELWDRSGKRLTLLIDPGRIKRGLKPREELGPVLEAGQSYTIHVARAWRDAQGQALTQDFTKKFTVTAPREQALDTAAWQITSPPIGTRDALVILFPDPLDSALLERTIRIQASDKQPLAGEVALSEEERRFEFRPSAAWQAGEHRIVIDKVLEDLAGNRIGVPFEVDELKPIDKQVPREETILKFTPR